MKKLLVIGSIILIAILAIGFLFHADCKKDCDKQPAYWYGQAVPYTIYSSFYNTTHTGGPMEEEPQAAPSVPHEVPPEEEPQTAPSVPYEMPPEE